MDTVQFESPEVGVNSPEPIEIYEISINGATIEYAARTHPTGITTQGEYKINQDNVSVCLNEDNLIFCLVDGVGGYPLSMATEIVPDLVIKSLENDQLTPAKVKNILITISRVLFRAVETHLNNTAYIMRKGLRRDTACTVACGKIEENEGKLTLTTMGMGDSPILLIDGQTKKVKLINHLHTAFLHNIIKEHQLEVWKLLENYFASVGDRQEIISRLDSLGISSDRISQLRGKMHSITACLTTLKHHITDYIIRTERYIVITEVKPGDMVFAFSDGAWNRLRYDPEELIQLVNRAGDFTEISTQLDSIIQNGNTDDATMFAAQVQLES
jgi:serine/threonine protein phosphatase PrpC